MRPSAFGASTRNVAASERISFSFPPVVRRKCVTISSESAGEFAAESGVEFALVRGGADDTAPATRSASGWGRGELGCKFCAADSTALYSVLRSTGLARDE